MRTFQCRKFLKHCHILLKHSFFIVYKRFIKFVKYARIKFF